MQSFFDLYGITQGGDFIKQKLATSFFHCYNYYMGSAKNW